MADLTLPEIRSAKVRMEQALKTAISDVVQAFQNETGLRVTEIDVQLFQLHKSPPASIVEAVRTEIDPQL